MRSPGNVLIMHCATMTGGQPMMHCVSQFWSSTIQSWFIDSTTSRPLAFAAAEDFGHGIGGHTIVQPVVPV